MAKSTRGKKVKAARKPRQPRQPKSASINAVSEEALRIQLFSCLYERGRPIEEIISDTSKVFDFIKNAPAVEVNAGPKPLRKAVKSVQHEATDTADIPAQPKEYVPEASTANPKRHFQEENILM